MVEEETMEEVVEETPVKKKGKLRMVLLIIVLLVCVGAAGGYFVFGDKVIDEYAANAPKVVEKKKEKAVGPILPLEPFLFNISGSNSKFAKVSIGIELKDVKVLEEAKKMIPIVRDKVLSVLGSKGPEMLMDVKNRDAIKQEIYASLKSIFKNQEDVAAIYITDIIIQ